MAYARKPCPACGERRWDREKDKICSECAKKIERYDKMIADRADRDKQEILEFVCAPPNCSHWFPNYFSFNPRTNNYKDESRRELQFAMAKLVWACAEGHVVEGYHFDLPSVIQVKYPDKWEGARDLIRMKKTIQEAIQNLDETIRKVIKNTFINARKDGLDVMNGLASGEMSIGELGKIQDNWTKQEEGK